MEGPLREPRVLPDSYGAPVEGLGRGASGVPSLFQEGKGVVVEGAYQADGTFHADTVIVKHGDRYQPPKPGETPPPFQAGN